MTKKISKILNNQPFALVVFSGTTIKRGLATRGKTPFFLIVLFE